jgi:hypothetical protein
LRNPRGEARHRDYWIVSLAADAPGAGGEERERELWELEMLIRQRPGSTYHSPHRDVRRVGGAPRNDTDGEDIDPLSELIADDLYVPTGGVRGPKPSGSRLDATARRHLVQITGLTPDEMRASLGRSEQANRTHREWVTIAVPAVRTVSSPRAISTVLEVSRTTVWRLQGEGETVLASLGIDPTPDNVERHISNIRSSTCSSTTP